MNVSKRICLVLAALLAALSLGLPAGAESGAAEETHVVACPQQGFTTRCEAGMRWRWDDVYGLTIYTDAARVDNGLPYMMIYATEGRGTDFAGYFDGVLTPWMRACLGDDLLSVGDCAVYTLGEGIELTGAMYAFLDPEGRRQVLFRLFDTRWGGNVCYTLRYYEGEEDDTLRALGIAAQAFEKQD